MRHRNLALGSGALLAAFAADRASEAWVVAEAARLEGSVVVPGLDHIFGRDAGVTSGLFGNVP